MQRVSLINWKNKNQDYDLSKIRDSLSSWWVVEWLEVKDGLVTSWYAFVPVTRNWITFNILFTLSEDLVLDTSWDKKVFIEVNQSNLDDWSINSSDWTWIWNIKTWTDYPSANFLSLADIVWWVITDNRSFIYLKWLVRKWLSSNSIIYIDSNWNEIIKVFNPVTDNWKAILIDETNWIRFESPWVDIWNLTEVTSVTNDSELIINVPGEWNKKVNVEKINHYEFGFWDGSDWDVTISDSVTLNRDMYYSNLHIESTWILNPNWYKIFVLNNFTWTWIIRRNWNNWQNWTDSNTGWLAWATLNQWTLNAEVWGGNWYIWQWSNWEDANPSYTLINGVYWWKWYSTIWRSSWWIATRSPIYNKIKFSLKDIVEGNVLTIPLKWPAWSWWGWWYRPNSAYYSRWWGAWWNGGVIFISARIFNFTWTIESKWWKGWNWAYRSSGWWWWQGWVIYIISTDFQNIWTHILTWWEWWINNSWSWGSDWEPWGTWNNWITIQILA